MFGYRKRLFYPVYVDNPDPAFAQILLEHYSGKDSEYSAVTQYLNQRANIDNRYVRELLGLIAAEEMGHMEMIAAAISKLGGKPLSYINSEGATWKMSYVDQSIDPIMMLQADAEAEMRAKALYSRHLVMTHDLGLKRMIDFLSKREDVHQRLFQKAQTLIRQNASREQFAELNYEYKMSLQVLE